MGQGAKTREEGGRSAPPPSSGAVPTESSSITAEAALGTARTLDDGALDGGALDGSAPSPARAADAQTREERERRKGCSCSVLTPISWRLRMTARSELSVSGETMCGVLPARDRRPDVLTISSPDARCALILRALTEGGRGSPIA